MITIQRPMKLGNLIASKQAKMLTFTFSTDNGEGYSKEEFTADAVVSLPKMEIIKMKIWHKNDEYHTWFDGYHEIFNHACKFARELAKQDQKKAKQP